MNRIRIGYANAYFPDSVDITQDGHFAIFADAVRAHHAGGIRSVVGQTRAYGAVHRRHSTDGSRAGRQLRYRSD